jgi:hypothetical protein
MIGRSLARALVLLLFAGQGLAPFLHAHAGAAVAASGAPLHLHLGAPAPAFDGAQWQADLGQIVNAPPEVRRDASLSVADLPMAGPRAALVVTDRRGHASPLRHDLDALTVPPPVPSARAPPAVPGALHR